jgi:chain length determinant protein (polysaccharide antigen chain regulator)
MTEKERPLSPQSEKMQNTHHQPEREISILDLLEVLVRKKVLIFVVASIFTLLSIIYTFSITPVYRATIGIQPHGKSLASVFSGLTTEFLSEVSGSLGGPLKQNYMFNKFITEFLSYSNQEKVFIEGKFLQRFVTNNPNIDMRKGVVQEIYRTILASDKETGSSTQAVTFEMKGTKPEVISDFLNSLADLAKSKVEFDVKESVQKGIIARLEMYSVELEKIRSIEKAEKADQIRHFSGNLEIAKNLGILDNNFGGPKTNISLSLGRFPIWYLYGQRALEQELKVLERREVSDQYIEETAELGYKIAYLSKIDLSKIKFEPVIISRHSIPPINPINLKKLQIIGIGVVLGLIIGILFAFVSNSLVQLKKGSKLSSPR